LKTLLALATLGAVAVLGVIYSGVYNVTATSQHTRPVLWALETSMRQAVRIRARAVSVPPLDDPALAMRGLVHYRNSCLKCHGAPGVPPEPFALGLLPAPNNLAQTALEWSAAELYWVTRNGLKMTAMPAWEFRYPDAELWAIVAFLRRLPSLTTEDYTALAREHSHAAAFEWSAASGSTGDARRGAVALHQYACITCHIIPGIVGATAHVGPSLAGIASRKYLAGRLPNTPGNMVLWLRQPQDVKPGTLMPNLEVAQHHALDIAAYLSSLK